MCLSYVQRGTVPQSTIVNHFHLIWHMSVLSGGEECFQDASHAFIKYHELKDTIKAVVN